MTDFVLYLESAGSTHPTNLFVLSCLQAVRNLLEATAPAAFEEMLRSTHDLPFAMGPFGEGFCALAGVWLHSTAKLDAVLVDPEMQKAQSTPLPNESYVTLNWDLEMTPESQALLFKRIRCIFDRVTGRVPVHQKKKYRMTTEELMKTRNLVVLFTQIHGHLSGRLSPVELRSWEIDVEKGSGRDEDLVHLMNLRPPCFAMSMLLSYQHQAKKDNEDVEMKRVELVEQQKQEVVAAQWAYFDAALKQDHALLEKVSAAPLQVRQRLHIKQVNHRQKVVVAAEKACQGFQDDRRETHQKHRTHRFELFAQY